MSQTIEFSKIKAVFDTGKKTIIIIAKIPEKFAWVDLELEINGRSVCRIKAKDQGGQEISREVVVKGDGEAHYSIKAIGTQRLYNSAGQLVPFDCNEFGSGQINISLGETYVIHEEAVLGPKGATFNLCLENHKNYQHSLLPDDLSEAEIMGEINRA